MKNFISQTIPGIFLEVAKKYPNKTALLYKKGHRFESLTFGQIEELVSEYAALFKNMGLKNGDRLVILSENRPEWIVSDLAVQAIGGITVPIHKVLTAVQVKNIVNEVEPKLIVLSDKESLGKVLEIEAVSQKKIPILFMEESLEEEKGLIERFHAHGFVQVLKFHGTEKENLQSLVSRLEPSDTASIIYTSGTTGRVKGVELTHANFVSNVRAVLNVIDIYAEDKLLSVLPLSHVFERTAGYYAALFAGASISYVEDITKIAEYAKKERPTIILAVPRLYEKVYEKVHAQASRNFLKRTMFNLALRVAKDNSGRTSLLFKLLDKLVFQKVRDSFGGRIRFFVSGGASLAPWLAEFFELAGMPVLEGYGLTETSPIVSVNTLKEYKFGTIGKPLPGLEVRLSDDGEILVKGPSVMKGYYENDEATKEAFTEDGWFRTGDLGFFDNEGFLKITGRKKELVVLTTGKKIFPVAIEEVLLQSPFIDQAMVIGDGYKHIGALIVPSEKALKEFGEAIEFEMARVIKAQLKDFSKIEQIRKFILISEPFTVENGMLTPTLKMKRSMIMNLYRDKVSNLYALN